MPNHHPSPSQVPSTTTLYFFLAFSKMFFHHLSLQVLIALVIYPTITKSFLPSCCVPEDIHKRKWQRRITLQDDDANDSPNSFPSCEFSRRSIFQSASVILGTAVITTTTTSIPAWAASRPPLNDLLYKILRVKEASAQETRLIKSGKFKDAQRNNVKLAVKFMVENYNLADAFVQASTYLDGGTERKLAAGQVGQSAVQSLITILEYFDSSDVQNLKVRGLDSNKEELVIKGLEAARKYIDEFLSYFPPETVNGVIAKIKQENNLNAAEWDSSLGPLLNVNPNP